MKESLHTRSAFTLIELAIALVIIGLIVGSVLVGRELIHAGEIRAQIKQIDEYDLAVKTFKVKYNCIPGDCQNAANVFTKYPGDGWAGGGSINGDGDGTINNRFRTNYKDASSWWSDNKEQRYFFIELEQAKLVRDKFNLSLTIGGSIPATKLNPKTGFFAADSSNFIDYINWSGYHEPLMTPYKKGSNALWFAASSTTAGVLSGNTYNWDNVGAVFIAADLQNIDSKIDDGKPLSGRLMGFGSHLSTTKSCVNGTSYNLSRLDAQCLAAFVIN